jgi:hypothetical protein
VGAALKPQLNQLQMEERYTSSALEFLVVL